MHARLILIVIPAAVLLQSGCGIDASTATKSSETAASSPSGYSYLSTCAWKFIGQDVGTVEKCLEWHMSDNLTTADKARVKANFEAGCLNHGATAKVSASKCVQKSTLSLKCEGKYSQETGNAADSSIFIRLAMSYPEANSAGKEAARRDADTSFYTCTTTPDLK